MDILLNLQMNQFLVNRGSDELFEFRVREPKNEFLSHIKFVSTKSLSRAQAQDLSVVYDGPKNAKTIHQLLPVTVAVNHELASAIRSTSKSHSIPENCRIVDILFDGQKVTCLQFNEVLQVVEENKNIYAMCPFGCESEEKVPQAIKDVNPMRLHR